MNTFRALLARFRDRHLQQTAVADQATHAMPRRHRADRPGPRHTLVSIHPTPPVLSVR